MLPQEEEAEECWRIEPMVAPRPLHHLGSDPVYRLVASNMGIGEDHPLSGPV